MKAARLLVLLFCACVLLSTTGAFPAVGVFQERETPTSAASHAQGSLLYAELVRYVRDNGLWKDPSRNHAFDRRFVRAVREPLQLTSDDFISSPESTLRVNAQVLQRLGVAETDILSDVGCTLSGGLRASDPEKGTVSSQSSKCAKKGQFVSVIFSHPRPTEDCAQPEALGGLAEVAGRCVVAGATEISQNSYYEYALKAVYVSGRGWKVVEATRVSGVSS